MILPEMQILKVGSWISDLGEFRFSYLNLHVAPSHVKWLGKIRTKKKWLLKNYPTRNFI